MRATAVIGANFGDEGKGLVTDYLSARSGKNLVIRFNGGAQAGHTIVTSDGRRHVFHHFGAGSLTGADTFLSRFFVVNPFLWQKERDELGKTTKLYISPDCPLTTPYDMLVNQEIERRRGPLRHGSCGVGFGETIERNERTSEPTTVRDICNPAALRDKLRRIRLVWPATRLSEHGAVPSEWLLKKLADDGILDGFIAACRDFSDSSILCEGFLASEWDNIVFEGAQGLLLDQASRFFPYVTRSKTGISNAAELADEMQIVELESIYVTRCYMTRHGVGPFPSEDPTMRFDDPTNAPNEFQGRLRFGGMDCRLVAETIAADMRKAHAKASLAVTCCDQMDGSDKIAAELSYETGLPISLKSYGPKRNHVISGSLQKI